MEFQDQVAVVTGAGRNIGEEVARQLAAGGARVAVLDNDAGRAERTTAGIAEAGGTAMAVVCDVSRAEDIERAVADIAVRWGRIDMLVNNVAVTDNKTILDITKEDWDRTLAITLTAPFLMAKAVAPHMIAGGRGGRIVNVGSTSGYFGRPRALAYTAAKGGVANMSRSMAIQLAPHGIRVNSVVPNKIGSPVGKEEFNPNRPVENLRGRPGVPADLAKAILFLLSDAADFITGAELFVDGGTSAMLPGSKAYD
jgi:NAD(P)-dependent dehydrogenase (short-subunit alcohol dehydrogenase family)